MSDGIYDITESPRNLTGYVAEAKGETIYSSKYTIDIIRKMMQEISNLVQNKPVLYYSTFLGLCISLYTQASHICNALEEF